MDSETRNALYLVEIRRAALDLIHQVDEYTTNAGSRSMLLSAKDKLARVLDSAIKTPINTTAK